MPKPAKPLPPSNKGRPLYEKSKNGAIPARSSVKRSPQSPLPKRKGGAN